MTVFVVNAADFQKHTQVEVEKAMGNYKVAAVKAQKEREAAEGQFSVLESKKTTLNKALKEAKVARDEAILLADSLRF